MQFCSVSFSSWQVKSNLKYNVNFIKVALTEKGIPTFFTLLSQRFWFWFFLARKLYYLDKWANEEEKERIEILDSVSVLDKALNTLM